MKRFLPLLAAIPLFGFTNCSYFSTVTVPAQDSAAPIVGSRMWIDGEERIDLWSSSHPTAGGIVVAVPFVYDGGGAKTLTVGQTVEVYCYNPQQHLGQITFLHYVNRSASQSGGVGSSVSNGLYLTGDVTDLTAFSSQCYAGFQLEEVTYSWSATGTDFANNSASTGHSLIWTASSYNLAGKASSAVEETSSAIQEALSQAPDLDPSIVKLGNAEPESVETEIYAVE